MKLFFLILTIVLFTGCDFLFSGGGEEEVYVVEVAIDSGVTVVPMRAVAQKGENVTFAYTLKEGYVLSSVTANGVALTPSSNTFSIVVNAPDQTVRVSTKEIEKQKFAISATAGPNGTVSPSGVVTVTEGQDQKFDILPNVGWLINTLKIDDAFVSPVNLYTFSNVTADASLYATFKKDSLLWPLLNIKWDLDSVYIDLNKWDSTNEETLNFSSNGKYIKIRNNVTYERDWNLDKTKSPVILTYETRKCKLEKINEEKLIFSYINELGQKVTQIYSNNGYK